MGVYIGARALLDINGNGLAISLAYPSGEEGGILIVQMISTCLRGTLRKRERKSAPCGADLHPPPSKHLWRITFGLILFPS